MSALDAEAAEAGRSSHRPSRKRKSRPPVVVQEYALVPHPPMTTILSYDEARSKVIPQRLGKWQRALRNKWGIGDTLESTSNGSDVEQPRSVGSPSKAVLNALLPSFLTPSILGAVEEHTNARLARTRSTRRISGDDVAGLYRPCVIGEILEVLAAICAHQHFIAEAHKVASVLRHPEDATSLAIGDRLKFLGSDVTERTRRFHVLLEHLSAWESGRDSASPHLVHDSASSPARNFFRLISGTLASHYVAESGLLT